MASFHVRSISLPSNSHPVTASLEEQLKKFKKPQSSSIGQRLGGLKELYDCVDDFLHMPLTQQTLSHEMHNQCVEKALDGSLRPLDICDTTRYFLSQIKECEQVLKSSLRRRRNADSGLHELDAYMVSRKKLNKWIYKYLRNLKREECNCTKSPISGDNTDLKNIINMLKDTEQISLSVFESILCFISQPMPKPKQSGWSVVSKLLKAKNPSGEENKMEKIEAELVVLKTSKDMRKAQNVIKGLEAFEMSLEEAEEGLECVYRRLVTTRVSLLNILNH